MPKIIVIDDAEERAAERALFPMRYYRERGEEPPMPAVTQVGLGAIKVKQPSSVNMKGDQRHGSHSVFRGKPRIPRSKW